MNNTGAITGTTQLLTAIPKRDNNEELKKALKDFESLFINQMMKTMREGVGKSELFHGGSGEDIYTSMLDEELAKTMSNAGGIGLEKMLLKQMTNEYGKAAAMEIKDTARPARSASMSVAHAGHSEESHSESSQMTLPVNGRISSEYGRRIDPFTGETRFHHGLDIAAPQGTPIYPARQGTVIFSGRRQGYGNLVEVRHDDGSITRYGHTAANLVRQGDRAEAGVPIALVGSTGRSTGPHLHFEVVKDGASVDPGAMLYG